jgi:hypothetical protein
MKEPTILYLFRVYFWEPHCSYIEFNSSNILRTIQWASEYIPELITDRYLSLFLRTTQHWCLRSPFPLPYLGTLGGGGSMSMFFISLSHVFLERPSCFVQQEPNMLTWVHWETFKASTNFFYQPRFWDDFS